MAELEASIVIPTYNGETYLDDLLNALERQHGIDRAEVIVIDSGSRDGTLDIVTRHPSVRLVEIPNTEFGHGRTRALGAKLARGRYVVYLTQDAVPADAYWLAEMIAPFEIDERIVLVTGRQIPRSRAFPLQKYEIVGAFRALGPDDATTLHGGWTRPPTDAEISAASFHSDVNAAVRRDRVRTDLPFRDVPYAEDQMMGRDVIDAGLLKAYAGRGAVVHSNDLDYSEYGARIFDETVGLRRIGTPIPPLSRRAQLVRTARGALGDTVRILRDRDFGAPARLRWLVVNPAYHARKWAAYRRASRVALTDASRIANASLEARRKTR